MWIYPARIRMAFALTHLAVVAMGTSHFPFHEFGRAGEILAFYGELSGAGTTYGFFADDMTREVRARFTIIDKQGKQREVRLGSGSSHEADLRVNAIASEFFTAGDDAVKFQRSLAASLAGSVFGEHPDAAQVIVSLEEQQPPSMAEYRRGERSTWQLLYEIRFEPSIPRK